MSTNDTSQEYLERTLMFQSVIILILAMCVGLVAALLVLPTWIPHLVDSLARVDVKAFWYLSRSSAFVALSLLWLSMVLGLLMTNKIAQAWPGYPSAFALHEYISLLGLGFAMFHALVLLGDRYMGYTLSQLVIPFNGSYKPLWVGIGQLGFYLMTLVATSYYLRPVIGKKMWRFLHFAGFLVYLAALIHGITVGSDTALPWAQYYYWITGGILLFLISYRVISSLAGRLARSTAKRLEK